MVSDESGPKRFSLKRWSQRKLDAARVAPKSADASPPDAGAAVPGPIRSAPPVTDADAPAARAAPTAGPASPAGATPQPEAAAALPPPESLTIDSDFTAFLQPRVDEALKRRALKQLFRDPRFNVMDGLDVYIDDYSKPDPIPPELVRQMVQGRYLFDPPATRVNEHGVVEDVPPAVVEEAPAAVADAPAAVDEVGAAGDAGAAPEAAPAAAGPAAARVPAADHADPPAEAAAPLPDASGRTESTNT